MLAIAGAVVGNSPAADNSLLVTHIGDATDVPSILLMLGTLALRVSNGRA